MKHPVEGSEHRRTRLLFLCHVLPFPPHEGVSIRAFHLLRQLSAAFDITAVCFHRDSADSERVRSAAAVLGEFARVRTFRVPQSGSRVRLLMDHGRSVAARRAYTRYMFESAPAAAFLEDLARREQFDVVHVDSLDLCALLPLLDAAVVACGHHNVESALLDRRARASTGVLRRWYFGLQARWLREEEARWCPRVDMNIVVSDTDRDTLLEIAPSARVMVVPNGADTNRVPTPLPESGRNVLFMGGYDWAPNRDGMQHFCRTILPHLRQLVPGVVVTWMGRAPAAACAHFRNEHGIDMTGYVADVQPYLERAACCVVPLRTGGGTRLKILDAWSAARPVVSTSIGCEGLDARHGENILIHDDDEAFAAAVARVIHDDQLREALASSGRATAEGRYDWNAIGTSLVEAYRDLAEAADTGARPVMEQRA
jgi:glycosyltransferase involved in cell wall biosynthesis